MLKTIFKVLVFTIIAAVLSIGGLYFYAYTSPKIPIKSSGKFFIYDNKNNLIYQGSSTSYWINFEQINKNLKNAIINIEDKNFYIHQGFDYKRIIGALIKNVRSGKVVEGASTISQQYVKNMYLSFDKTWSRKIEEAFLTLKLEVHYSKDEILEGYLNTINFGQGNYGIESASKYYFNKSAKDLSLEESCILAGIPKSPENYNPVSNYDNSIKRGKLIAKVLYQNNVIDKKIYKSLFKNKINIYGKRENNNLNSIMYYQDSVLNELKNLKEVPDSLIKSGGLKIYTNFDIDVQTNLENSIKSNMKEDATQVAAVYINPENGGIMALAGGRDYNKSQYNRITQAKRQVGSTIKPFLYYSALENGLTMSSCFKSAKTTFNLSNEKIYSPQNYNNLYANKKITMAAALAYSDNIYAVKTHLFLGEDVLIDTLKTVGITESLEENASLALGAKEINMLEYAGAYLTFASGGIKREPHFIQKVLDQDGNILYDYKDFDRVILNYNNVYIINEMMRNTYNKEYIDYNSPTAINISGRLTKKYAIKTGTTNNDHWVIGYNKNALLLVWTGMDKNEKQTSGYSSVTKNIWADTMEESQKNLLDNWYEKPSSVIALPLNPITGKQSPDNNSIFYFVKGTEPIDD